MRHFLITVAILCITASALAQGEATVFFDDFS